MSDKTSEEIRRGLRAEQILSDDLVKDAKDHIESELWRMFKEASPSDKDVLAFIKGMQYFHGKYFSFFERAISDGKLAKINLDSKKKSIKERLFS